MRLVDYSSRPLFALLVRLEPVNRLISEPCVIRMMWIWPMNPCLWNCRGWLLTFSRITGSEGHHPSCMVQFCCCERNSGWWPPAFRWLGMKENSETHCSVPRLIWLKGLGADRTSRLSGKNSSAAAILAPLSTTIAKWMISEYLHNPEIITAHLNSREDPKLRTSRRFLFLTSVRIQTEDTAT